MHFVFVKVSIAIQLLLSFNNNQFTLFVSLNFAQIDMLGITETLPVMIIVMDFERILTYTFAKSKKHSLYLSWPWCDARFPNFRCHFLCH